METKTKICSKCLGEKSLELFSINKSNKDGKEYICKDCMKKRAQEYRDSRKEDRSQKSPVSRGKRHLRAGQRKAKTKVRAPAKAFPTVTRATPEQIIADLRRGLAIEIIDMIQEKFGL